jgi:ring-1,2-phenylacetyl-CoA epoxidase subunit PaaC
MLSQYIIGLGDNTLILGQRLGEWCGHAPAVETDMALTNIALDLLGQTRSYFQYAAEIEGKGRTEDDIAFLRNEREYRNVLLVELPNEDFAYTIVRQFFFDAFHLLFLEKLAKSKEERLAAIAVKSLKEVKYHFRFSREWTLRLGDGTALSREKMQNAVNDLWVYTHELVESSDLEKAMATQGIGVDVSTLKTDYYNTLYETLAEATLLIPTENWWQKGGKTGIHTEFLGHILSEMQYLQRAYPNAVW